MLVVDALPAVLPAGWFHGGTQAAGESEPAENCLVQDVTNAVPEALSLRR
jgi:hypothetical protein